MRRVPEVSSQFQQRVTSRVQDFDAAEKVEVSEGGFRWGDAAIGAAAASGVALALHGVSMFRRQLRKEEQ